MGDYSVGLAQCLTKSYFCFLFVHWLLPLTARLNSAKTKYSLLFNRRVTFQKPTGRFSKPTGRFSSNDGLEIFPLCKGVGTMENRIVKIPITTLSLACAYAHT